MSNKIIIRLEAPCDYFESERITREAFWNLHSPGCDEHWVHHNMRSHADYIPELSFVILRGDEQIGSIAYSKAQIINKNSEIVDIISFGPVSILPKYHRMDYGRMLISHSIEEAAKQGYNAIVIGGYPYHYQTYGFAGSKKYNLTLPDGKFYVGIQVLPLYNGALDGISGRLIFSESMDILPGFEEYDKQFEYKEKLHETSQDEFAKTVVMIDDEVYQ